MRWSPSGVLESAAPAWARSARGSGNGRFSGPERAHSERACGPAAGGRRKAGRVRLGRRSWSSRRRVAQDALGCTYSEGAAGLGAWSRGAMQFRHAVSWLLCGEEGRAWAGEEAREAVGLCSHLGGGGGTREWTEAKPAGPAAWAGDGGVRRMPPRPWPGRAGRRPPGSSACRHPIFALQFRNVLSTFCLGDPLSLNMRGKSDQLFH